MTTHQPIDPATENRLRHAALLIRRDALRMVFEANSGHLGGSLSAADILAALYCGLMHHDPANPEWAERDRFVLSKGHCTPAYYAVLAHCGYFPREHLSTFRRIGSHLQGHPYAPKTPGVDASTGTLGLGLSTAAGMALAGRLGSRRHRVFVLCGDGEIQEGQVWEAAMFAAKYRLGNLIAFIDRNRLQTDGWCEDIMPLEPLAAKWAAFGWRTLDIDGHDFSQIRHAVDSSSHSPHQPTAIIARTVKGKGVSFMENEAKWHGTPPTAQEYDRAAAELEEVGHVIGA
jgi:transketolase